MYHSLEKFYIYYPDIFSYIDHHLTERASNSAFKCLGRVLDPQCCNWEQLVLCSQSTIFKAWSCKHGGLESDHDPSRR